jgi:hypothetical protein
LGTAVALATVAKVGFAIDDNFHHTGGWLVNHVLQVVL